MSVLSYVGKALKFPLEIDGEGKAVLTEVSETIEQSITNILAWDNPRFFLSPYYSKVYEVIEEPNIKTSHALIRMYTIEAIQEWEKRVDLVSVEVIGDQGTNVQVEIVYKIKETQLEETKVFPFYKAGQ